MLQKYLTFGTLKYRPARNSLDAKIGWTGLRNAHKHAYVWAHVDSNTGESLKGLGYPVRDSNGEIVNFLKMSFSGPLYLTESYIEESFETGLPIANCYVRFGKATNVILVTVDCLTAIVLRLATDLGTVAALYPGNLKAVCIHLRARHPNKEFKICVNGDGRDEDSHSLLEAQDAASAIGAKVYASGLDTFFALRRMPIGNRVQEVLDGETAVQPWGNPRDNRALKIAGLPTAWPHRFCGSTLLRNLMLRIQCHVSIPDDVALIVCLWVLHTYGIDKVRFSPLLAIMSPEYIEGTKTLLEVLRRVCCYGYKTSAITLNQLLTMVNGQRPTLLHDDGDALFCSQPFLKLLKTSHDRITGGITSSGSKGTLSAQSAFFAKATTSRAGLPKPVAGLAIPIQLHRAASNAHLLELPPFDIEANDEFSVIRAQAVRWWQDNTTEVTAYHPLNLDLGSDEANDTYQPLLAIASTIGPDILQRAIDAVKTCLAQEGIKSDGLRLLENASEVLRTWPEDDIHSIELAELLNGRDDWQWATYRKGMPLDQTLLASLLRPYGAHTYPIRANGAVKRGYHLSELRVAFAQYVRDDGPERGAQSPLLGLVASGPSGQAGRHL